MGAALMAQLTHSDLIDRRLTAFQVLVAICMLLVLVIDGVDIQLLSLLAPVIIAEWGADRASFGPALAAALMGMAMGAMAGGWMGDRFGRLRSLVLFTVIFGSATALASLTSNVTQLTLLRLVGGLGFGAASPNALALASEWLPRRFQSRVIAILSIGTPMGGMLGATLVLLLEPGWGWSGTFLLCGLGTVAFAVFMAGFLRESPTYHLSKGNDRAALKAVSVLAGSREEAVIGPGTDAGAAQEIAPTKLFAGKLRRLNIGVGTSFFFLCLAAYATIAWTTVILTDAGFSLPQALSALFAYNLGSTTAAICTGFLIDRFGSRAMLTTVSMVLALVTVILGVVLQAGAGAGAGAAGAATAQVAAATILIGLSGAAAGSGIATIYAIMAAGYPPSCRGSGMGFGLMMGRAGGIVLTLGGGLLLEAGSGSAWFFLTVLTVSACFGAIGAWICDRHIRPWRRGVLADAQPLAAAGLAEERIKA